MDLIEIYKCLCDETRLRILHLLTQGPLCVCHFQKLLDRPQVPVSKHLAYLRDHQLVEAHRRGQWMIYALPAEPTQELELQLQCLQDCVQTHEIFRADMQRLKKLRPECGWVTEALESPKPAPASKKVAGRAPISTRN